jgi:hypothetical protein
MCGLAVDLGFREYMSTWHYCTVGHGGMDDRLIQRRNNEMKCIGYFGRRQILE